MITNNQSVTSLAIQQVWDKGIALGGTVHVEEYDYEYLTFTIGAYEHLVMREKVLIDIDENDGYYEWVYRTHDWTYHGMPKDVVLSMDEYLENRGGNGPNREDNIEWPSDSVDIYCALGGAADYLCN